MGNRRLREADAFLNFPTTKTGAVHGFLPSEFDFTSPIFQDQQDAAPGRVSDGVKRAVERCIGSHGGLEITRKSMGVNVGNGIDLFIRYYLKY